MTNIQNSDANSLTALETWVPTWDNLREDEKVWPRVHACVCVCAHTHTLMRTYARAQVEAKAVRILEGHSDMVTACTWSAADGGGRWLLSASNDQTLRFWDVTNNSCLQVLAVLTHEPIRVTEH